MKIDITKQTELIAKYWDGRFPVIVADILENAILQARREGWEQAKMKAVIALGGCNTVEECWDAIAAMEYTEVRNDI